MAMPPKDQFGEHIRPVQPLYPGAVLRNVAAGATVTFGGDGTPLICLNIQPQALDAGSVWLTNGSNAEENIFLGGADGVSNRVPWDRWFCGAKSEGGGWTVRCGTNVKVQVIVVL